MMNEGNVEGIKKTFPNFDSWQESWHDNLERSFQPVDNDGLAIMDFERAEEKYNQDWDRKYKKI